MTHVSRIDLDILEKKLNRVKMQTDDEQCMTKKDSHYFSPVKKGNIIKKSRKTFRILFFSYAKTYNLYVWFIYKKSKLPFS